MNKDATAQARLEAEVHENSVCRDLLEALFKADWPEVPDHLKRQQDIRQRLFTQRAKALLKAGKAKGALRLYEGAFHLTFNLKGKGAEDFSAAVAAVVNESGLETLADSEREALFEARGASDVEKLLLLVHTRMKAQSEQSRRKLSGT